MEDIIKLCKPLTNTFTFWFHNPNDTNWGIDSYHEILNFSTIEEFWVLYELVKNEKQTNFFFLVIAHDC